MTRLLKAGVRLVARLVPEADADAVCGYWTQGCSAYPNGCKVYQNQIGNIIREQWNQQCGWCSDGTHYCGACYRTGLSC